jgi:hypothetical protein
MRKLLALVILAVAAPNGAFAQAAQLSEKDLDAAIEFGTKAKGKAQGLRLAEGGLIRSAGPTTGFAITIYTPTTWVREQASRAAKKYQPFTRADAEPVEPVLRVVAEPDVPRTMNAEARRRASSVEIVVIRDAGKTVALQPTKTEPFETELSNALGAEATYHGLIATFDLEKLRALRGPNGDAPFVITVVSTGGADSMGRDRTEKNFEVKDKHLASLP